jgi:hypothetical protein
MLGDPLGGRVCGSDACDYRDIHQLGVRPVHNGGRSFGGESISPRRRAETVEEIQDFALVQRHDLQSADAKALLTRVDDPVSKAMVLPVFVPPVVEGRRLGVVGQPVGVIVISRALVGVETVDQANRDLSGTPQRKAFGHEFLVAGVPALHRVIFPRNAQGLMSR